MSGEATTLDEAKAWLRERVDDGAKCPCCTQLAKVYERQVYGVMARDLIHMWRTSGLEPFHMPTVLNHKAGDAAKLGLWRLIEDEAEIRPDGGRAGWWRVTEFGRAFVLGEVTIPKYARVYDGRLLGFTGDQVTVRDCLGKKFNYDELMGRGAAA